MEGKLLLPSDLLKSGNCQGPVPVNTVNQVSPASNQSKSKSQYCAVLKISAEEKYFVGTFGASVKEQEERAEWSKSILGIFVC